MKRYLAALILLLSGYLSATTVTGTIQDINGNRYANGTVSAFSVITSTSMTPAATDANGFFSITLTPSTYAFTVCAKPVNIGPSTSTSVTQVCAQPATPIIISGGSQDVSTQINAVAPILGPSVAAFLGANNAFTGNNTHAGTETMNGQTTFNGLVSLTNILTGSGSAAIAGTFGGSPTMTGAWTLSGGGSLSGTWGGSPLVTGNWTMQGNNSFTGSNTFSGTFTTASLNGLGVAQGSTIASLINAGGDIIVPNGNYVLLADLTPPSNTTIFCVGWNAKFTMPSVTGAHNMITMSGKTNIRTIGCQFDGTGMTASTGDSHVIRAINSSNILLDGIWIHDSPEDCIRLGPSVSAGNVSNSRITNATLANCGTVGPSGSGVGCTDCTSITIDHNTITTPHLDGIDIEPQCVTCDGSKNTVDTNYLIGAAFSSHGISYWNHNGGTQQNNTTVGNTILQFAGGACVVLIGNTDGTVSANTEFACLVGTELQNSTLVTVGANDLKSNTTGILMDGASNTNNIISGVNINNSTTGITETNGSNGNSFRNIKFSANTNNFGTVGCSSVADWDTGNGGLNFLIPCNANTAGFSVLDAPSGSTHKLQFFPNLGAGNFYGTIQNGDALINYPNPLQIGAGIRDDGTGKWTAFNLFTLSGGLKFANLLISNTAPTIAAAGCGGAAAAISGPPNGTAAFAFNVGTTPTSACTLTLPAAATAWNCDAFDQTSSVGGGYFIKQTNATSQTSVVLSFFSTAGAATAPTASDIVRVKCSAY